MAILPAVRSDRVREDSDVLQHASGPSAPARERQMDRTRAWEALDLDTRVVHSAPGGARTSTPLGAPRHLPWRPQPQCQRHIASFYRLFNENHQVVPAAAKKTSWPAEMPLKFHLAAEAAKREGWPHKDLVLVGGDGERYVLHRSVSRGANSMVSLCSLQLQGLVLYAVAKTFTFVDQGGREPAPLAERGLAEREIGYSLVTGQRMHLNSTTKGVYGREGALSLQVPQVDLEQGQALTDVFEFSSGAAPFRLLRQTGAQEVRWHSLYPLQEADMLQILQQCGRSYPKSLAPSALREQLGHQILSGPLFNLFRLHAVHLFHQDIKLQNILMSSFFFVDKGSDFSPRMWASLVDFGMSKPNRWGSSANGTPSTHPPEAFLSFASYERMLQKDPPRQLAFDRETDDIYALGLVLLQLLVPHLPFPLIPPYTHDMRLLDADGRSLHRFDPDKVNRNHQLAQRFLKEWRPIHAQWMAYWAAGKHALPYPQGNEIECTEHGIWIDGVLQEVARLDFDFLGFVLTMLHPDPKERSTARDLCVSYREAGRSAEPSYADRMANGRNQLRMLLEQLRQPPATGANPGAAEVRLSLQQKAELARARHTVLAPNPVSVHKAVEPARPLPPEPPAWMTALPPPRKRAERQRTASAQDPMVTAGNGATRAIACAIPSPPSPGSHGGSAAQGPQSRGGASSSANGTTFSSAGLLTPENSPPTRGRHDKDQGPLRSGLLAGRETEVAWTTVGGAYGAVPSA